MNEFAWTDRTSRFGAALLHPDRDIPVGVGKGCEPAPKRYGVYRNNVVVSLMEALAATYPSTRAVLGDENFALLSRAFIASHPPRSPMMQQFGREFAHWMGALPALSDIPFLKDLALAERAALDAFHAADAEPLTPDDLASIEPDDVPGLRFERHPGAHVIRSDYAVHDLYRMREGGDYDDPDIPQAVLVTRPRFDVNVVSISHADAVGISILFDRKSLGEALTSAAQHNADFDAASFIALVVSAGAFQRPLPAISTPS